MSNGVEQTLGSPPDQSASALWAYVTEEVERSRLWLEELCRSFEGSDLQADKAFEDWTKEDGIDARQRTANDESERQKQIDSGSERRENKRK